MRETTVKVLSAALQPYSPVGLHAVMSTWLHACILVRLAVPQWIGSATGLRDLT